MKVNFIIAGAQKSGTSALRAALYDHPELCFHEAKEVHFFDHEENFLSGRSVDYGLYHQNFPTPQTGQLVGDKTPSYLFFQDVPRRLHEYNPELKIIILLRNPIDRAYSQYQMMLRNSGITETFMQRLLLEPELKARSAPRQSGQCVIERGLYSEQIERYLKYFPMQQLLILRFDEFVSQAEKTLGRICQFLEIAPQKLAPPRKSQTPPIREYPAMTTEERNYLQAQYKDELVRLENLLGWDCSQWR